MADTLESLNQSIITWDDRRFIRTEITRRIPVGDRSVRRRFARRFWRFARGGKCAWRDDAHRTSDPASRADAETVAKQLGIATRIIEVSPMVEPYLTQFVNGDSRRRGNVMARARMIALYDQSEEFHALVIGTSNKTEALLGHTTQFGDNAAAIHPIRTFYKAQVRQLRARRRACRRRSSTKRERRPVARADG
jgi:hypothetical protein